MEKSEAASGGISKNTMNIFVAFPAGVLLALSVLSALYLITSRLGHRAKAQPQDDLPFESRVAVLTNKMNGISMEVSMLLDDITQVFDSRMEQVQKCEEELSLLMAHHESTKRELAELPEQPSKVMKEMLDEAERRKLWRDLILFPIGVAIPILFAIFYKNL